MNEMRQIKVEKITLNIGTGKDQDKLEKGMKLLKKISNRTPVKTCTQKRIAEWGLRPGLPIGCKITLRNEEAKEVLMRLLDAKDYILEEKQFDDNGNVAFGVSEYIDIKGVEYDPEIGIIGLEVCVSLGRPGFRVKRRKIKNSSVPVKHRIKKKESIEFMKNNFNIKVGEE